MYKFLLILLLLPLCSPLIHAQFAAGGGIAFTTNTNDIGLQIKSQYTFAEKWRAEFSLDGYVTQDNFSYYGDVNLNINYIFTQNESLELHALLGGTYFYGSVKDFGFVQKGNAQGVNIGTGLQYQFNEQLDGYIDGIFTFTNFERPKVANRFLFTLGAIYLFD